MRHPTGPPSRAKLCNQEHDEGVGFVFRHSWVALLNARSLLHCLVPGVESCFTLSMSASSESCFLTELLATFLFRRARCHSIAAAAVAANMTAHTSLVCQHAAKTIRPADLYPPKSSSSALVIIPHLTYCRPDCQSVPMLTY